MTTELFTDWNIPLGKTLLIFSVEQHISMKYESKDIENSSSEKVDNI